MPGLVVKIDVAEGDEVQEGQALATVEAMKMENILKAERKGVVKTIKASAGAQPEGGRRDHGVRVMQATDFCENPEPDGRARGYRPAGFFSSASVRAMGILSMELTISRTVPGQGLADRRLPVLVHQHQRKPARAAVSCAGPRAFAGSVSVIRITSRVGELGVVARPEAASGG